MEEQELAFRHFIYETVEEIRQPDREAAAAARRCWDNIAKPLQGLGRLEDIVVQIAGIQRLPAIDISRRAILVLCGDHGVVSEGVTQTGSQITKLVAENIADGKGCVSIMAKRAGADVFVADLGMDCPPYPQKELAAGAITDRKVCRGTGNIAAERAMTRAECLQAVAAGIGLARDLAGKGYQLIGLGEMGIGNTTPASSIAAICYDLLPELAAGKGAGLSAEGLERKTEVIARTKERYWEEAQVPAQDAHFQINVALELLSQAGGAEIAGLAGACLGAAACGIPVLLDGFISDVAAAAAVLMSGRCREYLIASHLSSEPAATIVLNMLKMQAIIDADMHLGEGTGAAAAMPMLDMAADVYREMKSFSQLGMEAYQNHQAGKE